jgi:hypothetical protein
MSTTTVLKTELNFYKKHKEEYLKLYNGQFVLIKGEQLIGVFTTDAEAYRAGVQQFGNQPFLIKPVVVDDAVVSYPAFTVGVLTTSF